MIGVLVDPRFPMSEVAVVKNLRYFEAVQRRQMVFSSEREYLFCPVPA
jgi:hypothetical protein